MTEELQEVINTDAPERTASTQMQEAIWGDEPIVNNGQQQQPNAPAQEQQQQNTQAPTKDEDEIIEPKEWLKRELDTDDIAVLKAEREELKSLRTKANESKPFEFKNEDSKKVFEYVTENKLDELFDILSSRKKIEKLSSADLNANKDLATELVKFGIKNDNPSLNDDEVDFIFSEKYTKPTKPVRDYLDDDADYENKVKVWQQQVDNIEKRMVIEAKMAQPKIAQLKSELVFPEIKKGNNQNQPTQEDLAALNELKTSFLQSAEQTLNGFNGFSIPVKDKDVDYTVGYAPSQEEKTLINSKLKEFAESGLDANALLADRWVNEDGKSLNVNQMVKDLSRIYGGEKIDQKLVTDSANKRIEAYLKEKKQIDVNGNSNRGSFVPNDKTQSEKMQEQFWS